VANVAAVADGQQLFASSSSMHRILAASPPAPPNATGLAGLFVEAASKLSMEISGSNLDRGSAALLHGSAAAAEWYSREFSSTEIVSKKEEADLLRPRFLLRELLVAEVAADPQPPADMSNLLASFSLASRAVAMPLAVAAETLLWTCLPQAEPCCLLTMVSNFSVSENTPPEYNEQRVRRYLKDERQLPSSLAWGNCSRSSCGRLVTSLLYASLRLLLLQHWA
jgi:hypothetical protein